MDQQSSYAGLVFVVAEETSDRNCNVIYLKWKWRKWKPGIQLETNNPVLKVIWNQLIARRLFV